MILSLIKKTPLKFYEAAFSDGNCSVKKKFTSSNFSLYYIGNMKVTFIIVGTVLVVKSIFM